MLKVILPLSSASISKSAEANAKARKRSLWDLIDSLSDILK